MPREAYYLMISIEWLDRILNYGKSKMNLVLPDEVHTPILCDDTFCKWLKLEFTTKTVTLYEYLECFFLSVQPKLYHTYLSSIKQCIELKDNDKNEFNFVLVEKYSHTNECFLFIALWMQSLLHKSSFYDTNRLRRLATFSFLHRQFQ